MNVPLFVALNKAKKKPIVVDDKIEIAEIARISFTVDHRFVDGANAKPLVTTC